MSSASAAANMSKYVTLLSGVRMPRCIYGTAWKKDKTTQLVAQALGQGFRGVDTACQPKHYREDLVGAGIQQAIKESKGGLSMKDLFIQTKFTPKDGQDKASIPYNPNAELATQVMESFQVTQKNLNTETIDSLVLHSPCRTHADTMIVWRAFEELVKQNLVRGLGISNIYDIKELQKIYKESEVKPSVIQNRFYPDSEYDVAIRKFCKEKGIYYQSFWTLTGNPHFLKSPQVLALAEKYRKTPAQIWYRFCVEIDICFLTGTCNVEHMIDDLAVLDFALQTEEVDALNVIVEHISDYL